MANILDSLGGLGNLGRDAILELMSKLIDALGEGTEWTGEQLDKLGELEQAFGALVQSAKS